MSDDDALGLPLLGWREWLSLPDLNVPQIKVKVDTGARSSALHAFSIQTFDRDEVQWVRFDVIPFQRTTQPSIRVEAPLVDERWVRSSNGQRQLRPVIRPDIQIGVHRWQIDLTLASRDMMGFRMLLGREAVRSRFLIDPSRSYLIGKRPRRRRQKQKL